MDRASAMRIAVSGWLFRGIPGRSDAGDAGTKGSLKIQKAVGPVVSWVSFWRRELSEGLTSLVLVNLSEPYDYTKTFGFISFSVLSYLY